MDFVRESDAGTRRPVPIGSEWARSVHSAGAPLPHMIRTVNQLNLKPMQVLLDRNGG